MDVPNVKRKDYQLIGMEDDFLSLMDDSGDTRDDLKCPEGEIGDEIRAAISEEKEILVSYILIYSYMVADPDLNWSGFNRVSGSRFGIRLRTQEGKNDAEK